MGLTEKIVKNYFNVGSLQELVNKLAEINPQNTPPTSLQVKNSLLLFKGNTGIP